MKKLICLLLALVMLLALVGCDEPSESTPTEPTTPTTTQPPVTDPPKPEISRGSVDGTVYTNAYLGFEFHAPSTWVYSTDEEIAAMMNLGVETLLGSAYKDVIKDLSSAYDMMVADVVSGSSLLTGYESLKYVSNITEEQYLAAVKAQMENVSGVTVVFPDTYDTVRLGQTEFMRAVCTSTAAGVTFTQVYYVHKVDGYMSFLILTVAAGCEYTLEQIEGMFQ